MTTNNEITFDVCRDVSFYSLSSQGQVEGGLFVIPFSVDNRLGLFPDNCFVEICRLHINKPYRRQGYGLILMTSVLKDFAQYWICLMVEQHPLPGDISSEGLTCWYERLGFKEGSPFHEGIGWMHKAPSNRKFN